MNVFKKTVPPKTPILWCCGRFFGGLLSALCRAVRSNDVSVLRHAELDSASHYLQGFRVKHGMTSAFAILFAIANLLPCTAQTRYYVSTTGSPAGNALSWATACNDLQLVINNAQKGDTIWVAQGTYIPIRPADSLHKIDSNNRDNAFTFIKGVCLYGGFAGWETDLSQRILPFKGSNGLTVLSGNIGNPADSSDNAYHVLIVAAPQQDTVFLNGLTITAGFATAVYNQFPPYNIIPHVINVNGKTVSYIQGGGIYNRSHLNASYISVINNVSWYGGGIYSYNNIVVDSLVSLMLSYSIVSDNWGLHGNGIYASLSDLYLYRTDITHNKIVGNSNWGGGLTLLNLRKCILHYVAITDNEGCGDAGGISINVDNMDDSSYILNNLLIANNIAYTAFSSGLPSDGVSGGIMIYIHSPTSTSDFIINNTTIVNNIGDGAITHHRAEQGFPVQFRNCIIFGHKRYHKGLKQWYDHNGGDTATTYTAFYNCLLGRTFYESRDSSLTWVNTPRGAFVADPMFVDTANRDYRLQCGSPAVNMGINAFYSPDSIPDLSYITTDLDVNPRFYNNGIIDLGCYELQDYCYPFIVLPPDITICEGDSVDIPIFISGEPPYMLAYTANGGAEDTLKNITSNPYYWRVSPQDTTLYVFTYVRDIRYDSLMRDSITVRVLHPPNIAAALTNETLCSGQQTKAIRFINIADSCSWEATGDSINPIPFGLQIGDFGAYTIENKDTNMLTTRIKIETFSVANEKVCYGDTGSFTITVRPVVALQAGTNDSVFCEGDSILFILFNTENLSDISWQGSTGEFSDTGKNVVIVNATQNHTGVYIVKASSHVYCIFPDTVKATVLSAVITNMDDTLFMCDWEDIMIESNASNATTYLWNTGDTTKDIKVSASGTYYVEASNERCFVMDTVVVMQINVSDFKIITTGDLCTEGKIELTANIEDVSYQWNTGDTIQTVSLSVEGFYSVTVYAEHCQAYQEMEITCPCSLSLPNFFSPNNDGCNDEYIPEISFELHRFSMVIYDRWGMVVYRTEEFRAWNGKNNGRDASAGVYYCVVEYSCKDNPDKKRFAQSSVTLMR